MMKREIIIESNQLIETRSFPSCLLSSSFDPLATQEIISSFFSQTYPPENFRFSLSLLYVFIYFLRYCCMSGIFPLAFISLSMAHTKEINIFLFFVWHLKLVFIFHQLFAVYIQFCAPKRTIVYLVRVQ